MTRHLQNDDRGISTLVSHTLAIAITSILVVSLLLAANTYLIDQKQRVADDNLQTVGNRLASEVAQVDRLSNRSANVTLWATHQKRIAGAPYEARIEHGSECNTGGGSANNCLVIFSAAFDAEHRIPIQNDTAVSINQTEPGRFQIVALQSGNRDQRTEFATSDRLVESNMRFGIGSGVEPDTMGTASSGLNLPPTNLSIRIDSTSSSAYPQSGQTIDFIVEAEDTDGDIASYDIQWGDGTDTSISGIGAPVLNDLAAHSYSNAGTYELTLMVTDDDGATSQTQQVINVSGIQLNGFSRSSNGARTDITFDITNAHNDPISIQSLYLNPSDDSTNTITNPSGSNRELWIDIDGDGSFDRPYEAGEFPRGSNIPTTGMYTGAALDDGTDPSNLPSIGAGSDAAIWFRGLDSGGDDTYELTINYIINGDFASSQFRNVAPGTGPTASFNFNPSNPTTSDTVNFDASGSSDSGGGSITSYDWDFGDSTSGSGETASHSYSSPGTYTVQLTVEDGDGNTDTVTQNVVVTSPGSPVILDGDVDADEAATGSLNFDLENTGSSDVEIEEVAVEVTSGGPYDEVNWDGFGSAPEVWINPESGGTEGEYTDPIPTDGVLEPLDTDVTIDGGERAEVELWYFRNPGGNLFSVAGETIEFTVEYDDGTQQTFTVNP